MQELFTVCLCIQSALVEMFHAILIVSSSVKIKAIKKSPKHFSRVHFSPSLKTMSKLVWSVRHDKINTSLMAAVFFPSVLMLVPQECLCALRTLVAWRFLCSRVIMFSELNKLGVYVCVLFSSPSLHYFKRCYSRLVKTCLNKSCS